MKDGWTLALEIGT